MESPEKKKQQLTPNSDQKRFLKHYALAFELVILNVGLITGGYFLDAYFSTIPLAILLSTFLAIVGTIWMLLKFTK